MSILERAQRMQLVEENLRQRQATLNVELRRHELYAAVSRFTEVVITAPMFGEHVHEYTRTPTLTVGGLTFALIAWKDEAATLRVWHYDDEDCRMWWSWPLKSITDLARFDYAPPADEPQEEAV